MTILYDFPRSSSCYRVRIALNLKGIAYERRTIDFRQAEQRGDAFLDINPAGLVPALQIDGRTLTQSIAIIDYLDAMAGGPRLIPTEPAARADILALSLAIACDIHPIDNLRVLDYLRQHFGADEEQVSAWYQHWVRLGLAGVEAQLSPRAPARFVLEEPSLFETCLIPQLYNARRYHVDLSPYQTLLRIEAATKELTAFTSAAPE